MLVDQLRLRHLVEGEVDLGFFEVLFCDCACFQQFQEVGDFCQGKLPLVVRECCEYPFVEFFFDF